MKKIEEPPFPDLAEVFARRWYVAQVISGREQAVADLLRQRQHAAIVPVVKRYRRGNRYAKGKKEVSFPELKGYVIVGFMPDAMQAWADLFRFSWVRGVLSDDVGPMPVERAELIRFMRECGEVIRAVPEWEKYMITGREFGVGDQVEVLDGQFAGHVVKVTDITDKNATIVLRLFGRRAKRVVPLAILQKAE